MNSPVSHRAQIASHIPGRLRVRLHHKSRPVMNRIKRHLETQGGVHTVKVNPVTGSVTVHYDRRRYDGTGILGLLRDVDVVVEALREGPAMLPADFGSGEENTALSLAEAINDLNERLSRLSGIPVNLRILLPLAFAVAGLWSISKQGLISEQMPGWLLLWFAFDIFIKLHPAGKMPDHV